MAGRAAGPGTRDFFERTRVPTVDKPFTPADVRRVVGRVLRAES